MSNQVLLIHSILMVHTRPNLMLIHPAHDVTAPAYIIKRTRCGTT